MDAYYQWFLWLVALPMSSWFYQGEMKITLPSLVLGIRIEFFLLPYFKGNTI
jgi:hypothetical protein